MSDEHKVEYEQITEEEVKYAFKSQGFHISPINMGPVGLFDLDDQTIVQESIEGHNKTIVESHELYVYNKTELNDYVQKTKKYGNNTYIHHKIVPTNKGCKIYGVCLGSHHIPPAWMLHKMINDFDTNLN